MRNVAENENAVLLGGSTAWGGKTAGPDGVRRPRHLGYSDLREAMSMEKRYLTSLLRRRS
jgi:hypothetical protein